MMVILMYNIVVFTVIVLCLNCKVNIRKWKLQYFLSYPPCVFGTLTLSLGKAIILIFLNSHIVLRQYDHRVLSTISSILKLVSSLKEFAKHNSAGASSRKEMGGEKNPMYY